MSGTVRSWCIDYNAIQAATLMLANNQNQWYYMIYPQLRLVCIQEAPEAAKSVQVLTRSGESSIFGFGRRGWSEILSLWWVMANQKTPSGRSFGPYKTAALGAVLNSSKQTQMGPQKVHLSCWRISGLTTTARGRVTFSLYCMLRLTTICHGDVWTELNVLDDTEMLSCVD